MHLRRETAARRNRERAGQERGLINATFVGSYPTADFAVQPPLPEIGFLGRSNVGKSSLINALTNRRALARTSRTPGKTRLCNVYDIDERYYLVDLPGYGYAKAYKTVRQDLYGLLKQYFSERTLLDAVTAQAKVFSYPWRYSLTVFEEGPAKDNLGPVWARNGQLLLGGSRYGPRQGADAVDKLADVIERRGVKVDASEVCWGLEAAVTSRRDNAAYLRAA